MKRRGENCAKFEILPGMMSRFNTNMYDHKGAQPTAPTVVPDQREEIEEDDNEELIQVLNDVEQLFGQPVFFTQKFELFTDDCYTLK